MSKLIALSGVAALPLAFAGATKPAPTPKPAENTNTEATAPKKARVAPEITAVSADVPMPTNGSKRGSNSSFPFDSLTAVGMSFGVKNRTAASLSSIISAQKRKHLTEKRDGTTGAVIFKTKEMTAPDGTKTKVPSTEPEMVPTKTFFAVDVDPTTDPQGASVRVFRDN